MKKYTFEFEDGSKVTYEANDIIEAIEMKVKEYENIPWTIRVSEDEVKDFKKWSVI